MKQKRRVFADGEKEPLSEKALVLPMILSQFVFFPFFLFPIDLFSAQEKTAQTKIPVGKNKERNAHKKKDGVRIN